jgi:hypothetical protein
LLSWGHTGLGQHFKDGKVPAEVKDVPPEVLDWGEVWAMQAFMRRIQPDDLQLPEDGYWIWQNGWWAGLFDPKPEISIISRKCVRAREPTWAFTSTGNPG